MGKNEKHTGRAWRAVAIATAANVIAVGLYHVSHTLTAIWMIAALAAMFVYEAKSAWIDSDEDKQQNK